MKQTATSLRDSLCGVVEAMGYEFVGCELLRQGKRSLLRVYIDSPKGITLDDCSTVSYQISAMLDVEDPIQGEYNLEISSPGIDRPLFDLEHYKKYVGKKVKIRLQAPIDNRRNIVGVLLKVEEMNIHLLADAEELVVPFSEIEKAKLIADY